jgi:undecaprenyl-diphosphatase
MTSPRRPDPIEERLAKYLSTGDASTGQPTAVRVLRKLSRFDRAMYRAVAEISTPQLDGPLRRLSDFANFSKPWFLIAGLLGLFGGANGRRTALTGVAAIGLASLVVNQPMKLVGERHRPDRTQLGVPESRWVSMPSSTSFPSGHSASAAAFATSVGDMLPALSLPLRMVAAAVMFSRVYTGVHYPSDVIAGAAAGVLAGRLTSTIARRLLSRPG